MATISFKADSTTLILNGQVISDFIAGDIIELAPKNPHTARSYGADKSVNIIQRTDAEVYDLKFSVLKNSDSDIFLNNELNKDIPVIFNGSVKEIFVKDGTEYTESFEIEAGSFTDKPTYTKNNQDGNFTVEYTIECYAKRLV